MNYSSHASRPVISSGGRNLFLFFLLCLFVSPPTSAQAQPGTPPFGSFGGGPDIINLGNLNGHLTIRVMNKPGRGANFTYDLSYDTSVWYPVTSGGSKIWYLLKGWTTASPATMGYVTYQTTGPYHCRFFQETQWVTEYYHLYNNWLYTDSLGIAHTLIGAIQDGGAPDCGPADSEILTTNDGSGYKLSVPDETLYTTAGALAYLNYGVHNGTFTDRNGNQITQGTGGVFTDTLGTTALTVTGPGTPASPIVLTFTPPNTSSSLCSATNTTGVACYVISYVAYTVKSNFGCSGISEYPATVNNLVDRITLPDGSYYQFYYEATPGYSGDVTGRLASVRLPTGGSISYTYTAGGLTGLAVGSYDPIVCADGSAAGLTRQTPDGTWTYSRTQVSGNHWQTKLTTPPDPANSSSVGDDTIIDFQKDSATTYPTNNFYETLRVIYQGVSNSNVVLRTVTTCYDGNTSSCTTTAVSTPITQRTVTDQYGSSGLQCLHNYYYNSVGGLSDEYDYDYGSGAPGSFLRHISITYAPLQNITSFRKQIKITNSSGTVVSQTNYNYDETTPTSTSGIAQHGAVYSSRGNLTSVNYPVSGLTSHFTYYDTGSPNTSQDINTATTTYNYGSASCQMAFPTSISEPLSMSRSMAWNCTGGVLTSLTDENRQVTSATYNDAFFWRPANVNFPDGGQTSWTYNSPTNITITTKMNSSQNIVATQLLDGLGRALHGQLNSDPQGIDYVDTTYDPLGRLASVSNPYRSTSDPTYGLTSYQYDALSRVTKVTLQDGSFGTASYTNNTVTGTDPAGKKRQSTLDSLGRLTQITEDPGGLGYVTTYAYDALGNLTSVTQNGGRPRTFGYDALSRMTSESTPEAGTITYGYDASGHSGDLTSRVSPAANQTGSATATTTYTYDLLHRLTAKTYSDNSTPSVTYNYDQTAPWGWVLGSPIGRLTTESTSNSSGTLSANLYSYDPLGRVLVREQCQPLNCAANSQAVEPTYDLAGNITSQRTVQSGVLDVTISYTYDSAARPISVTSTLVDSQHPGTLASGLSYAPTSAFTQMTLGNGLLESRSYNNRLQATEIKSYTSSNFVRYDFSYGYNDSNGHNNGNLMSWNSTGWDFAFNRSYSYDSLNRLATMQETSGSAEGCKPSSSSTNPYIISWGYDAWGNRTSQSPTAGTCSFSQSVNTQNQLFGSPYQYDAAGNMIRDASHTYTYDAENRLVSVDGGSTASYVYDAEGNRVQKTASGAWIDFIPDVVGSTAAETNAQGWHAGYIYLNGKLLAEYDNGTTYFVQHDHLGSARLITGPEGSGLQSWDYLPYGELLQGVFSTTHLFTGDERDSETDLDHTWFRQYSSQLGRWMTPDPAGLAAVDPSNPQSWNRYSYVSNNPMNVIDPLGLWCLGDDDGVCVSPDAEPGNCTLNGVATDCGVAVGLVSDGVASPCPNSDCMNMQLKTNNNGNTVFIPIFMSIWVAQHAVFDAALVFNSLITPVDTSYPSDGSILSQIMNNPRLAANWTSTFTGATNLVNAGAGVTAAGVGIAAAAPAVVAGAAYATGTYLAWAGPTAGVVIGTYLNAEQNYVEAAEEEGFGALNAWQPLANFFQATGNWLTLNMAYIDKVVALGRPVYVYGEEFAGPGSYLWIELARLAELGVGPSQIGVIY
jgi:RHS repeat-associated protein